MRNTGLTSYVDRIWVGAHMAACAMCATLHGRTHPEQRDVCATPDQNSMGVVKLVLRCLSVLPLPPNRGPVTLSHCGDARLAGLRRSLVSRTTELTVRALPQFLQHIQHPCYTLLSARFRTGGKP